MENRIIFSDDGTLSDFTVNLNDYFSGTSSIASLVATEDALYIGSRFAFNHIYCKISAANDQASVMSIATWDGSNWNAVAEVFDQTSSSGATLAQSGYITWVPDKNKHWAQDDTQSSTGGEQITDLGGANIYDHYWIKITFSADLGASTALSWLGYKFTDDNDLGTEFPDLVRSATLTGFESGKTDWEEQHVLCAKLLIDDLIKNKIILSGKQLLEREIFKGASVQKCAEVIYGGLGDDYKDDRNDAKKEYEKRLQKGNYLIDRDEDGFLDDQQEVRRFSQGSIIRR